MGNSKQSAHPVQVIDAERSMADQKFVVYKTIGGLTKREHFAIKNQQAIISTVYGTAEIYKQQILDWKEKYGESASVKEAIAKDSIELADELLKQLESLNTL